MARGNEMHVQSNCNYIYMKAVCLLVPPECYRPFDSILSKLPHYLITFLKVTYGNVSNNQNLEGLLK